MSIFGKAFFGDRENTKKDPRSEYYLLLQRFFNDNPEAQAVNLIQGRGNQLTKLKELYQRALKRNLSADFPKACRQFFANRSTTDPIYLILFYMDQELSEQQS